ncbi:MAG: hypothetical protein K2K29_06090 [Muribaculaceae bacterium]|nr:hypothetical protein [Muribaculaceae bacterium]
MDTINPPVADGAPAIELCRYDATMKDEWDRFADTSRNATSILRRDFMDYHSDRFADHSLIARRGRKILALLAANECVDDSGRHILQSHGGLTYGGWICGERHPDAEEMLQLFRALQEYCLNLGIEGSTIVRYPGFMRVVHRRRISTLCSAWGRN